MQGPGIPPPPPGFKPVQDAPPPPPGFAPVQEAAPNPEGWQQTQYGFRVRPAINPETGKPTLQREDGAYWFDQNPNPRFGNLLGNLGMGPGKGDWFKPGGSDSVLKYVSAGSAPGASTIPNMGLAGNAMRPLGRFAEGSLQAMDHALSPFVGIISKEDPGAAATDQLAKSSEADYQRNKYTGPGSSTAEFAGNFAIPVPGLGQGGGALMRYVGRPALQAMIGAGSQPVLGDGSYAGQKALQIGVAAPTGVLSNLALQSVAKVGGKIANAVQGRMNPAAQQVIDEAAAQGVTLKPSAISKLSQPPPEEVTQAQAAVQKLSDKLSQDIEKTPFAGLKDVEAAAAAPGPRQGAARAILERVKAGGEPEDLVQTSAGLQALREKMRMDQLGQTRNALAEGVTVDPSKPVAVIDKALQDVAGADASKWPQKQALLDKLQQVKENLTSSPNSFASMMKTRSDVGDELSDYFKGNNAEIGQKGSGILQNFKNAINDAMSDAAQSSGKPELAAADKIFNKEYSKFAGTFKDPTIVQAIQSSDPDKIVEALAKAGTNKAQRIYDALEPKGQAALAKSVFSEATKDAVNPRTGDFIPGNVAMGINKKLDALGVTLKGENKMQLDGLQKVMQYLGKVEPSQVSALGQRGVDVGAHLAETSLGWPGKLASYIKEGGTDALFNSPSGKKFLFASSQLKTGSPAMDKLISDFLAKAPAVAGIKAANSTQGQKEQP